MTEELFNKSYYTWYNETEKLRLKYPSELVVGFLVNNLKAKSKVLDLGCGSGRHVLLSAELGHEAYGLDLGVEGLKFCSQTAKQKGLSVNLKEAFMSDTGFEDDFFDAVICHSAINGNSPDEQKRIISEVLRILKEGGIFFVSFYGKKDYTFTLSQRLGKEIAKDTFIIPGNVFHSFATGKVPDYLCNFSSPDSIERLLSGFKEVRQFEFYLPYGNSSLQDDVRPSQHLIAIARK